MAHEKCLKEAIRFCDCLNDDIQRLAVLENLWQELKAKQKDAYWKIEDIIFFYRKKLG